MDREQAKYILPIIQAFSEGKTMHHFGGMTIIQHLRLVISITALSQNLSTVHLIMRENV